MAITVVGTNSKGQQIQVTIEGATTTVETRGFVGRSCQQATAALEAALGRKTQDTPTAEAFKQPVSQTVKQG